MKKYEKGGKGGGISSLCLSLSAALKKKKGKGEGRSTQKEGGGGEKESPSIAFLGGSSREKGEKSERLVSVFVLREEEWRESTSHYFSLNAMSSGREEKGKKTVA